MLALSLNVQELLSGFLSKERERLGRKVLSAEFERDLTTEMNLLLGTPPAAQDNQPFIAPEYSGGSSVVESFRATRPSRMSGSHEDFTDENLLVGNPVLLQQILAQLHAPAEIRKELADEMGEAGTISIQGLLDLLERSSGSNGTVKAASVRDLLENIHWKENDGGVAPTVSTMTGSSDFDLNRLGTILADAAAPGDPQPPEETAASPTSAPSTQQSTGAMSSTLAGETVDPTHERPTLSPVFHPLENEPTQELNAAAPGDPQPPEETAASPTSAPSSQQSMGAMSSTLAGESVDPMHERPTLSPVFHPLENEPTQELNAAAPGDPQPLEKTAAPPTSPPPTQQSMGAMSSTLPGETKHPVGTVSETPSNPLVEGTNGIPTVSLPHDADVMELQVEMGDEVQYGGHKSPGHDAADTVNSARQGALRTASSNDAGSLSQDFGRNLSKDGSESGSSQWQSPKPHTPETHAGFLAASPVSQAGASASVQDAAGQPTRLHLDQAFWPQELTDHLARMSREDRHRITLELEPKHLGKLTLRVETHGMQVSAWVQADHPDARDMLLRNASFLQQLLSEQGLNLGNFSVDVRHEKGAAGDRGEKTPDRRRNRVSTSSLMGPGNPHVSAPLAYDGFTGRTVNLRA